MTRSSNWPIGNHNNPAVMRSDAVIGCLFYDVRAAGIKSVVVKLKWWSQDVDTVQGSGGQNLKSRVHQHNKLDKDSTMDLVLNVADYYVLTPYVYPASWPEDGALRQILSLLVVTNLGAAVLYLGLGAISYFFIFDHKLMKHPHFLENQVQREIKYAMTSLPWISIPTVALFFAEVRGYSKLYDNVSESPLGWPGLFLSMISFLFFTDMCIYWIHRLLHHKLIYKLFHKPHHIWKIPTPFASHAFHPVDGFMQGLPYHIYPFLFPLHKVLYLALYVFVNIWTISIHDGDYRVPGALTGAINGSAHHTDHHLFFEYNYGQYFTLWDRLGGSYRHPSALMGKGPHDLIRKLEAEGKLGDDRVKGKGQVNGHAQRGVTCKEE